MSIKVIAHRGASRAERENTLLAFRAAQRLGADWVELDARRTADDEIVVHHDPRLTDGRAIVDLTVAELPEYIPTLEAALTSCGSLGVNIEIKNDPMEPDFDAAERVARRVAETVSSAPERFIVSSFRYETIEAVRAGFDAASTAWLVVSLDEPTVDRVLTGPHRLVHPSHRAITAELLSRFHAAGIGVNVWTVDDPGDMARLAGWGVDGLCTNVPDVAVAVLANATGSATARPD